MFWNLVVVLSLYAFVISLSELAHAFGINDFIVRKLAHISCGVITALLPIFLNLPFTIFAGLLLALFVLISKSLKIFNGIENSDKYSWGTLYFPLGFILAALIFWNFEPMIFRGAALILGFADGGAALAGKYLGRKTYLSGTKTIVGSFVFFLITCLISLLIFDYTEGGIESFTLIKGIILVMGAAGVTAIEAVSRRGLDNIFIPVAAGALLLALIS